MNVTSHGVKNNTVFQKTNNLVMFFFLVKIFLTVQDNCVAIVHFDFLNI